LVEEVDPMIGRVIASRYRLEQKLGAGAMGAVYRAKHVKMHRAFAIKILHVDLLEDSKLQRRFQREAELAGTLSHPNIVRVTDVGETFEGLHYIAMEYAEGPTLGDVISQAAPMPAPRIIELVAAILDGLHHAHKHGLIHRDFKPDNVIVVTENTGKESPRIVDFGIAIVRDTASSDHRERLTTAGITLGTPHYMAPEHVTGQEIDHRIDLFAVGIVLYEMLTGKMPFDGDGVDVARANLLQDTPAMATRVPGIAVDPLLEAFTRLLMAKSPDGRPTSAKAARELLDLVGKDRGRAAQLLGVTLSEPPPPARVPRIATPPAGVPRFGTYTPPQPMLVVPQPVDYAPAPDQNIFVAEQSGPVPIAITAAASSRNRSARVSQPPLPRTPSGTQPQQLAPKPRVRTESVKRVALRQRRLLIMLSVGVAALALGAILAVLLS
jgi:serine/threonine-protein kinase